ncbi:crotonase/enoyl-CoA hydratase family protein [Exilibacterium tricleocarpae]|uniref:Crotonase/enoyl-CoA hydratase family protein n=1 Tax=Exilibacterium tricleocarpae TaxID=2591008 RepID=A0A545TLF5_9GAMM|nr:crotonase/enoyl-CoA hydratase family protein [Exilibacterium tricleocarpae]TQV78038.1 crotonase/enoyl-CoA hydratase family protein [Exilibacterium tricleocarpae]
MTDTAVTTEVDGPVFIISINLPQKRNAVDRFTAATLRHAFEHFEENAELRVAVLTGAGGNFCAGADLVAMEDPARRNEVDIKRGGAGPMGPTRMALSKPLIAAVAGYAVAGGLELALMCDLRIAEQSAVFGVFCRRWGVPLIDGGTVRLPRIVGQGRALDMILTGRPVHAEEALQMGLANRVVADGESLAAARALAHEIAGFPQQCVKADRLSVYRQWDYELAEALVREIAGSSAVVLEEAVEGSRSFASGKGRHGQFDNNKK